MLTVHLSDGVANVVLNRPPVNAWDEAALRELGDVQAELENDDAVRVVLVRSQLPHFSAGGDIQMMNDHVARGDFDALAAFAGCIQLSFRRWRSMPKPTIALLNGAVYGGGLEFALSCDIRVASDAATFALPEVSLGLVPAGGGTQIAKEALGRGGAALLMMAGEPWSAAEALDRGLVQKVVAPPNLEQVGTALAHSIANGSGAALRAIKVCLAATDFEAGFALETASQATLYQEPDTQQRLATFANKTKADLR